MRSSTVSYHRFNLLMDRSPGFGSNASNYAALFRLALAAPPVFQYLKLATYINSPDRSTKSTRLLINELSVLVGTRFQVLFHSPPGVLFTFPSRYCSSIGHQVVFRVGGWSPRFPTGFHVSGGTLDPDWSISAFDYGTLTPCGRPSHAVRLTYCSVVPVLNPRG